MDQQQRAPSGSGGVSLLVAGTGLLALFLHLAVLGGGRSDNAQGYGGWAIWGGLTVAFALSEMFVVHLPSARSAHTHTFGEVPVVLALVFLEPRQYLVAVLLGSGVALLLHQRQPAMKVAFNLVMYALQAAVAVLVFRALLGPAQGADLHGWAAAAAAVVAIDILAAVLVTAVIYLAGDGLDTSIMREALRSGLLASLANTSVALIIVVLLVERPMALPLLVVVLVVMLISYRAYVDLARRHTQTRSLYRFVASTVADSADNAQAVAGVLSETRDLLGANSAELLFPTDGGQRLSLGPSGEPEQNALAPGEYQEWAAQVAGGVIVTATGGLAAPVRVGHHDGAVLVVGERLFDADSFSPDDLGLLSALAGHAGGVLQRADLLGRLRAEVVAREHEARHDPLTGLPNRRDLERHLHPGVAEGTRPATLLLLGLDHFRQVNDTLGHRAGDEVLIEVGRRLQRCDVGPVARLGGDEFVVLVHGAAGVANATELAATLLAAVRAPILVHGVDVVVAASIGVALAPEHGSGVDVLLANADLAMAAAKSSGTEFAIYRPTDELVRRRRLRLAVDLGPAMPAGEVLPWFQPQVAAGSGRLVAVEALVRWDHPTLGLVTPDDILPVATSTGLQRRLTDHMLTSALHQRTTWTGPWRGVGVAVNVTTRDLLDESLPAVVAAALAASGTDPSALTIEVTEEGFMSDVSRCLEVLDSLADLGVKLSIDDFGTGYSSLEYLQRLPVHEIKVDMTFVRRLEDSGDDTIVRSIVDLAHALGMSVVVEGVERADTWDLLQGLGADIGQGWLFGRPRRGESAAAEGVAVPGQGGPVDQARARAGIEP